MFTKAPAMPKRLALCALTLTLLLAAVADAASTLSMHRGKAAITAAFRQELSDAPDTAISQKVGPCARRDRVTVVCDTAARLAHGDERIRCTKYYRARLRSGRVRITESTDGRTWKRFVRSRCVTAA